MKKAHYSREFKTPRICLLRCMGTSYDFPEFYIGKQLFLTAFNSLNEQALTKQGLLLKERVCSTRSKLSLLRIDPF